MTLKRAKKWMSVLSLSLVLAKLCDQEAQDEMQQEDETTE